MTGADVSDKFGIAVQVMHVRIRDCKRHPSLRCNRVSRILQAWAYANAARRPAGPVTSRQTRFRCTSHPESAHGLNSIYDESGLDANNHFVSSVPSGSLLR
jgi:hypothetical protein